MSDAPARVALTTLGCKVNYAEMAELAGALAAAGLDVVPEHEHADVRVLNSCTVTLQADATTRQRLRRLRRLDPQAHLVLTGCSVDANPDVYLRAAGDAPSRHAHGADTVFANRDKHGIARHVLEVVQQRTGNGIPPPRRARAFIKVQDGCDHRCTYCIVWKARGASTSVPRELVLQRVRAALGQGHAEVVLCGVDLGSWGRDSGDQLADLVTSVLDAMPDGTRLRLSSINANDVSRQLIELNAHPKLCSHWHLPLQSGSDAVLKAMHRGYRRAQYARVVAELREQDPLTEFTTDVMVGFPGERDDDHRETLRLVAEVGFLGCHVFRWSARPGTPATALPDRVDDAVCRRRSAGVRQAAAATAQASLRRALQRDHAVVWDGCEGGIAHGLAATYHEVLAPCDATPPAGISVVRAEAIEDGRLRGTVVHP